MALGTKFFRKVMPDSLPLHVGQIDHTPMVHHYHFENKFKFAYFEIGSRAERPDQSSLAVLAKRRHSFHILLNSSYSFEQDGSIYLERPGRSTNEGLLGPGPHLYGYELGESTN